VLVDPIQKKDFPIELLLLRVLTEETYCKEISRNKNSIRGVFWLSVAYIVSQNQGLQSNHSWAQRYDLILRYYYYLLT